MKKRHITTALGTLAIAVLVGGCGSVPTNTSLLDQTRRDYLAVQSDPKVASLAALELKQAGDALRQANDAALNDESPAEIDRLAYIARQKIALTQEAVKQKTAEAQIASATKERDQIRLEQRTAEAENARRNAEQAKLDAARAQSEAAESQRRALSAQGESVDAQRRTQEAQARAAQLEAQLADLAARQTERGTVITLNDVLFGTDQARLTANGRRNVQKLADLLQQHPERTVVIEGFTDSTGTARHNQELSERRAAAVRSALQEMGVAPERVVTRGYGESYPVASNDTAENRQLNRRVEIVLSDASGKVAALRQ